MALSIAHRQNLEQLIECAVCMDISNDPRRFPCGHSFCYSCLEGLWASSQPSLKVRCPQCRKDHWLGYEGPKSIPKDFIIDQIKEMVATLPSDGAKPDGSRLSRCEFCLSQFPTTSQYMYCLNCDSLICSSCSQKHRCGRGATKSVIKLDFQCSLTCAGHKHPVRYICDVCNSLLCKRCQVQGVCGDHDLFDVFLGRFLNDDAPAGTKGGPKRQPRAKPKFAGGVFVGLSPEKDGVASTKKTEITKKSPNKSPPKQKPDKMKSSPPRPKSAIPNVAVISPKATAKVKPAPITAPKTTPIPSCHGPKQATVNITPTVTCVVTSSAITPPMSSSCSAASVTPVIPPHRPPPPTPAPIPAVITPIPVRPVCEEAILPWKKDLSSKGRSVAIMPSGDFTILTEKCVYLFDKNGTQLDSYSDIEDPWGISFWSQNGAVVISERRQRRLSVFTISPKKRFNHSRYIKVNAKAPNTGLLSMFKSPDAGPLAVATLSDGGLVVTTARVSGDAVTYLNEVIVFNIGGREQYRWQCEPAPQGVTSINSYILLTMRNCVKVYTPDGHFIQEFGDKRLLFDPGCLCPYNNDVIVTHRKSYICDNVSIWRISKWSIHGQRHGHLVEMSEIEDGPLMGIMANDDVLIIVSEKNVSCQDIKHLYVKRF